MQTALPVHYNCPKSMKIGPCGGVFADGGCETEPESTCVFLDPSLTAGHAADESAFLANLSAPGPAGASSGFKQRLDSGRFAVIAEVNGADSADASTFVEAARVVSDVADIVSVTDHSGANVHMGNIAAVAHLKAAGLEVMPTFGCRDRNRIALQGDLLGAASLGVRDALLVTGNHVLVGDSPSATAVFDLDSPRLLAIADRLRTEGRFDNGRAVEVKPDLHLGSVAHPFAPPLGDRPRQVLRKVRSGADFIVTQHIFDLPRWREFIAGVNALRGDERPFALLGGVAIMPSEPIARAVNAGLRGFSIPEQILDRLRQAKDPQDTGLDIAAETVRELHETDGVAGCLLAPVTGRQNALTASAEQAELIAEVRRRAGIPVDASAQTGAVA